MVLEIGKMENKLVLERIEKLRGRRAYEEKRAAKLGYMSLYDYFEDKLLKEDQAKKSLEKTALVGGKVNKRKALKQQTACKCC